MNRYVAAPALLCLLAGLWSAQPLLAADDKAWGSVKGQVILDPKQEVPARPPLDVTKDQQHCLEKGPILNDEWIVNPKNRGVRDVFIWLAPNPGEPALAIHPDLKQPKEKELVFDQPRCQFVPHAFAIREGQTIVVKNSAPISHNTNWTGHPLRNPGKNIILPPGGTITISDLKADRLPVQFKCDIHPWMKAWARVFDHPYYAVTDENGNFEIKNAPAGSYRIFIWHETGFGPGEPEGRNGLPITVKGGAATDVGSLKLEKK